MTEPRVLFYDIETKPLLAYVWKLGEQVIRHDQLKEGSDRYDIISIGYCWNDGKPAKVLDWGLKEQNSEPMIKFFDRQLMQADIAVAYNGDRFDIKHINTQRMLHGLIPLGKIATDDPLKQIRRHFAFPSNTLDYLSKVLGMGGKHKMVFQDWIDIVDKKDPAALAKMIAYNKKDVEDLRDLYNKVMPHCSPKLNRAAFIKDLACTHCGSHNLVKNGTRLLGLTHYQVYFCKDHGGFAGRVAMKKDGTEGSGVIK